MVFKLFNMCALYSFLVIRHMRFININKKTGAFLIQLCYNNNKKKLFKDKQEYDF